MRIPVVAAICCAFLLAGCNIPVALSDPGGAAAEPRLTTPPISTTPIQFTPTPTPTPLLPQLTYDTPGSAQTDAVVSRTYNWDYGGKEWTWELKVSQAAFDYFKALPRSPTRNYSVYATHPLDDPYIGALAARLKDAARSEGYSESDTIGFAAAFVQSLPYVTDDISTAYDEYPRYPVETLMENGGDCEDTSILMAALVSELGYGVVLLGLPDHMAVGVAGGEGIYGSYWDHDGKKYYYLETTGDNWELGEIPDEYFQASAKIYDMDPAPILTHEWTANGRLWYADLTIEVTNLGSAPAEGVHIYAGFDAGDDTMWNPEKSPEFDIGVDGKVTVTLSIRVPYGKHTRILVQVIDDGYAVDESYSEWVET